MEPSATSTTVTGGPVGQRFQAGSEDAPVSTTAPLRRLRDSGAGYKYPDLLTYFESIAKQVQKNGASKEYLQERVVQNNSARLQVQLEENDGSRKRQSWMKRSGLWSAGIFLENEDWGCTKSNGGACGTSRPERPRSSAAGARVEAP